MNNNFTIDRFNHEYVLKEVGKSHVFLSRVELVRCPPNLIHRLIFRIKTYHNNHYWNTKDHPLNPHHIYNQGKVVYSNCIDYYNLNLTQEMNNFIYLYSYYYKITLTVYPNEDENTNPVDMGELSPYSEIKVFTNVFPDDRN